MRYAMAIFSFLLLTNCSVNILEEFSDSTTNDALLFSAKQLINEGDYSGAIAKFDAMSADFLSQRDVKTLRASAYLGLCSGIDFLDLIDAIGSMGGARIIPWIMSTFQGGTVARQTACVQAEDVIKTIHAYGESRTSDENLLMAFIGFAKMGAIITRYGDSGTPDGTVDAGFDPCDVGDIPSVAAREFTTGLNIAIDSLSNIGSSTIGSGAISAITAMCATYPTLTFCTDPPQVLTTDINALEEQAVRSLMNESQDVGLGTCTGDVVACACP